MSDDSRRLAVLIDADNTSPRQAAEMFEELASYGTLTVKRAYGDWTSPQLTGWKSQLHAHAISPMQQFAYTSGKNSTDSALIIDAMDLLYAGNLDGFVIVSSDSDFTRLATRLRESGMTVYGLGQRKTPKAFQDACDKFTYLEVLGAEAGQPAAVEPAAQATAPARGNRAAERSAEPDPQVSLESLLIKALNKTARDDGWSRVSDIGSHLIRTNPAFDARSFGFAKLGDLVSGQPYVETKTIQTAAGESQLWARAKQRRVAQKSAQKSAPKAAPKKAAQAKAAPSK